MWQVLEAATNTSSADYKVTIRRAAFVHSDDYEFHKKLLDHLRDLRNHMVHVADDLQTIESNLYLLKSYVEDILLFHFNHGADFDSFKEVSEF